jgi:mono/diheme cytochrome c family protein
MVKRIFVSAAMIFLSACGAGSGEGLNNQGLPQNLSSQNSSSSSSQSSNPNTGVTLASLQQNIFGAICIACHTGSTAPHGLRLDSEDNSYAFLVNHAADEVPELMRANPGHPDDSYIIRKLEGAAGIVGGRMPLGGPYLSQEQINTVRDWIANGAPRSGTGTALTKISHVAINTGTITNIGTSADEKPNAQDFSASLHFSRAIEPDSVDINSVQVSYTTENSDKSIALENMGVLILDQSLEISTNKIPADAKTVTLKIISAESAPIVDVQERAVDSNLGATEGSGYRYEKPNQ